MFWDYIVLLRNVSILECGLFLAKELTKTDFEMFVVMCWSVWTDSCKILHSPDLSYRNINMVWANSNVGCLSCVFLSWICW